MPEYLSLMGDLNFLTVGEPFEEYLVNESKVTIKNLYRISNDIIIDRKISYNGNLLHYGK